MAGIDPLGPFGQVLGTGVGIGAANALVPPAQDLANEAWRRFPDRPLDPLTLASGVAQGQVDRTWATDEALNMGVTKERFDHLVDIANIGPGIGRAFEMWRRAQIGEAGFRRAVRRLGLEDEWIDDLVALKQVLLTPAELAVMVQRTVVPNPGLLPNQPSTAGSNVPPMPTVDIDVLAEAAGSGVNADRLAALARIIGLPASPDLAARMHFRDIITEGAFNQAILEGNTRGEWAPFLLEGFREILTSNQYAQLQLRGYFNRAERLAGTQKHGMSDEDSDHLYDVLGRSVNVRAVTTGLARGGKYPGSYANVPQPYRAAIQRGNLREEYAELAYANRFSYPSAFVLRALAEAGELGDVAAVEQILLEIGWKPSLAKQVAAKWVPKGAAVDPLVKSEQRKVLTRIANVYTQTRADEAQARGWLTDLGIAGTVQDGLIKVWDVARQVPGAGLTRKQLKDAFGALPLQWPRARVLQELEDLGMEPEEAQTYLDE